VTKREELAFQILFRDYGLKLTTVIKDPPPGYQGEAGSLTGARILQIAKPKPGTLFYMSGPEPMVEAFTKDLAKSGVNKHDIITDYFPGYQQF